jgi:hypothetical protein
MRKTLLVSVAAAALAAASFANAQTMNRGAGPAAGPSGGSSTAPSQMTPSQQGAPADTQATPDHGPAGQRGMNKGAREPQKGAQQQPGKQQQGTQQRSTDSQMHRQPGQQSTQNPSGTNNRGTAERGGRNAGDHNRSAGDRDRTGGEHSRSAADRDRTGGDHGRAAGDRRMTTSNVSLTTEQRTTIRQKVLTSAAPRVSGHVNFDIRVGVVVPRTVRVAPVPVTLVEIEPQWRGYMYFVSGDEIIVVEPGSLRIVAVLDV